MKLFTRNKKIGIDLGTSNTLLYTKEDGIILREPSVIAINTTNKKVIAVGSEAKEMIGRAPGDIETIRPLKAGVIANFDVGQQMLIKFIEKAVGKRGYASPNIVICYPSGITEVEKRAINEAVTQSGSRKVMMIVEAVAAALGAGLPVEDPIGSMIIDLGGGTTEIATISLGGIVISKTLRVGGDALDEAIINYVKRTYNLLIGEITAENIKIQLGSVYEDSNVEDRSMQITGKSLVTGLPSVVSITESEIRKALSEPMALVIDAIRSTIEQTPPELSVDIMEKGITLSGGGALLKGIDKLIFNEIHIPVNIAENPLDSVVLGAGKCLNIVDRV